MLVARVGLLPAAMSRGIGSDSQRPFANVIVGGLMAALILGIFLLPTLYVWVAGERDVLPGPEVKGEEEQVAQAADCRGGTPLMSNCCGKMVLTDGSTHSIVPE